jgi:hypothetical protein
MKTALLALTLTLSLPALAQSAPEKLKHTANDARRTIKKGAHRVEETLCTDSKLTCAGKKAANRVEEAKDTVKDKATEVKDKLDSDSR